MRHSRTFSDAYGTAYGMSEEECRLSAWHVFAVYLYYYYIVTAILVVVWTFALALFEAQPAKEEGVVKKEDRQCV